jgi:hypothetical protein
MSSDRNLKGDLPLVAGMLSVARWLRSFYREYERLYDRRNTPEWDEELRWLPDGRLRGNRLPDP